MQLEEGDTEAESFHGAQPSPSSYSGCAALRGSHKRSLQSGLVCWPRFFSYGAAVWAGWSSSRRSRRVDGIPVWIRMLVHLVAIAIDCKLQLIAILLTASRGLRDGVANINANAFGRVQHGPEQKIECRERGLPGVSPSPKVQHDLIPYLPYLFEEGRRARYAHYCGGRLRQAGLKV